MEEHGEIVQGWLLLDVSQNSYGRNEVRVAGWRANRPRFGLAVKVKLEIPESLLEPIAHLRFDRVDQIAVIAEVDEE